MKTQLIQLDSSDDVISVRDKMGWSQTNRILLIWPEHGQVLSHSLDLVLLQRHSHSLGAQLALVTDSSEVKEIARQLHLPVFVNPRQAQNSRWRSRRHKPLPLRINPAPDLSKLRAQHQPAKSGWQDNPFVRASLFGISLVAILAVIMLFLPSARIKIQPETREQTITLPVKAHSEFSSVNLAGEIPAHIETVIVEARDSIPATGSILIPGEYARGAIKFTNLTDQSISIPSGLVIMTLERVPVRFFTTRSGIVPAGAGHTLTIPAQALVPGETGNLPPTSLVAIEGELGLNLSATNPIATHGGTDVLAPAPTSRDMMTLSNALTATLRSSALADLQANLSEGDLLITTSLELARTVERLTTPSTGLPGDQLDLTLRLEFQAIVVNASDLYGLIEPVLDGNLPSGFTPAPDSLALEHNAFSTPNESGLVTWEITARRMLRANISPEAVFPLAAGQSTNTAAARLAANLPLTTYPDVEMKPAWWPWLPYLPFRVQVITR